MQIAGYSSLLHPKARGFWMPLEPAKEPGLLMVLSLPLYGRGQPNSSQGHRSLIMSTLTRVQAPSPSLRPSKKEKIISWTPIPMHFTLIPMHTALDGRTTAWVSIVNYHCPKPKTHSWILSPSLAQQSHWSLRSVFCFVFFPKLLEVPGPKSSR